MNRKIKGPKRKQTESRHLIVGDVRATVRWHFEKPDRYPCITYHPDLGGQPDEFTPAHPSHALPSHFERSPRVPGKTAYELKCSMALAELLGGVTEVPNEAGRVDVLTNSAVIELKVAHNWKHGIGQLLVYGHYYPGKTLELVLVGIDVESYLELSRYHCSPLGINVSTFGI